MGVILGLCRQSHGLQNIGDCIVNEPRTLTNHPQGERNIVENGLLRKKAKILKNHTQASPELGDLATGNSPEILAQNVHISGARSLFFQNKPEKTGFA